MINDDRLFSVPPKQPGAVGIQAGQGTLQIPAAGIEIGAFGPVMQFRTMAVAHHHEVGGGVGEDAPGMLAQTLDSGVLDGPIDLGRPGTNTSMGTDAVSVQPAASVTVTVNRVGAARALVFGFESVSSPAAMPPGGDDSHR